MQGYEQKFEHLNIAGVNAKYPFIFLGKVVKNWYKDYDCFYDHFSKKIIFHKEGKFFIQSQKKLNEPQRIEKFNIGNAFGRVYACAVNSDETMIAIQNTFNCVYVFNNSARTSPHGTVRKQYELDEYRFEYPNARKILGFSFASSNYFNFFICNDREIEILNFNKYSSNVMHVKKIPIKGEYLLYELHFYNIATVINKEGVIQVVDLNKNPRTKNLVKKSGKLSSGEGMEAMSGSFTSSRSSRMSITDRALSFLKSSTVKEDFKAVEPINNKNILMISEKNEYIFNAFTMSEDQDSEYPSLHLAILYNIPYIMFLNNKIGKIEIYQFDIAERTFLRNKNYIDLIPECQHAVHSIDNLLLVHNLDAQFSKIFDLSVKPITDPV